MTESTDPSPLPPPARSCSRIPCPWAAPVIFVLVDLLMLTITAVAVVLIRRLLGGEFHPMFYFRLWPVLLVFILAFAAAKLYPGVPANPPEELRRIFFVVVAVYLGLGTVIFMTRDALLYSRAIFLTACLASFLMVFIGRGVTRYICSPRRWWGFPVIILGGGVPGRDVIKSLLRRPEIGLKPVGYYDAEQLRPFGDIQRIDSIDNALALAAEHRQLRLILVTASFTRQQLHQLLHRDQHTLAHMIVIPDLHGISTLGVAGEDLNGTLGLYVQQRLLDKWRSSTKRVLDLLVITLTAPLYAPILGLIALAIKLDSPGPIFFGHQRIGRHGKPFIAWKFRTMVVDAQQVLENHLADNEPARVEWQLTHKLKNDPRISRVGRCLRRLSLDELPQLWNVLKGRMSLVGPRPIVDEEIKRYADDFDLYTCVRPGMTGLWQVSGRNNLPYRERVRLDVYYIRNWSIWLDLYIVLRTFVAITRRSGAY